MRYMDSVDVAQSFGVDSITSMVACIAFSLTIFSFSQEDKRFIEKVTSSKLKEEIPSKKMCDKIVRKWK